MNQENKQALEKRVAKLERRGQKSLLAAVLGGLAGAVLALLGDWMIVRSQEEDRHLKLMQIRTEHIHGLRGDFEKKKHALLLIASEHSVDDAVDIERYFRDGSTIRVLEKIHQEIATVNERELIEKSLKRVKGVLVIDSRLRSNVYCSETSHTLGTNVDDIAEALKEFPIRIAGRKGDEIGIKTTLEEVRKNNPDLLLVHLGAFEGLIMQELNTDESKMLRFLPDVLKILPNTQVILYSRHNIETLEKVRTAILKLHPDAKERLGIIEFQNQCFGVNDENRRTLRRAIRRALQVEMLYTRDLIWPNPAIQPTTGSGG